MPRLKADDSDEDWDYSSLEYDSDMPDVISSDSDEDFQEDFMHRAILGRPRSKIYDSSDYVSEATGMAERSGLDAARLDGTNETWKAAEGSKRVRKAPAVFVASSASCMLHACTGQRYCCCCCCRKPCLDSSSASRSSSSWSQRS